MSLPLTLYTTERDAVTQHLLLDANEHYEQWVKLSPSILTSLHRYPDNSAKAFRQKLAKTYCYPFNSSNIFASSGSIEAIDLLIQINRTKTITLNYPTYDVYEKRAKIHGLRIIPAAFNSDGQPNVEAMLATATDMIVLINPNNPTGNLVKPEVVSSLLKRFKGLLVIDEAYIEYAGLGKSLQQFVLQHENVVILRTFSKAWGLAGVRLGYVLAGTGIIRKLEAYQNPYSVNAVALQSGIAALEQQHNLAMHVRQVIDDKHMFISRLQALNLQVKDSAANFVLLLHPEILSLYQLLREEGILVRPRPLDNLGNNCLRITIGSTIDMEKLYCIVKKHYE